MQVEPPVKAAWTQPSSQPFAVASQGQASWQFIMAPQVPAKDPLA